MTTSQVPLTERIENTEPSAETVEAILEAARDVLADGGLEALSMRAVAERVGLSATAIYHHFKGKDDLFTKAAIDASITWKDAQINGPAEFRDALLERGEDELVRTVTEKLLIYALGRGLTYHDAPTVRQLVRDAAQNDYRWSSLILGIVQSAPFQERIVGDTGQQEAEQ